MEASYPFQLCEHAIHGWAAVYPTTTHLSQSQNWTLISEPFIREELVRVLKRQKIKQERMRCLSIVVLGKERNIYLKISIHLRFWKASVYMLYS